MKKQQQQQEFLWEMAKRKSVHIIRSVVEIFSQACLIARKSYLVFIIFCIKAIKVEMETKFLQIFQFLSTLLFSLVSFGKEQKIIILCPNLISRR